MKRGRGSVTSSNSCIFCRIREGKVPAIKVFEDHWTLAIMEPNPLSDGHTLIVTTSHLESLYDLSPVDCGAVMLATKLVALAIREALHPDGLNVIQATGRAAGQWVAHFRLDIVPRWANDGQGPPWTRRRGNIDRIRDLAERIRQGLPYCWDELL